MLGYPNRSLNPAGLGRMFQELRELREQDPDRLGVKSIQFAGEGEPLLHKQLPEICAQARAAGIDTAILTNAVALKPPVTERLLPHLNGWLQASINAGCAESYAKIHRTSPEDWGRAWHNLADAVRVREELGLTAENVEIGANMTVLIAEAWDPEQQTMVPANWQEMERLARLARDTGLDYVSFKPYSQHPYSEKTAALYGGISYQKLMTEIESRGVAIRDRYQTDQFEVVFRLTRFREYEQAERGYSRCRATPTLWSYIQSDGVWISCSAHWTNPEFHLGNINTQTVREIWFGERRRQHLDFVRNHLDVSICRKGCHPDKENVRLEQLGNLSDVEFAAELVRIADLPRPRTANFT